MVEHNLQNPEHGLHNMSPSIMQHSKKGKKGKKKAKTAQPSQKPDE